MKTSPEPQRLRAWAAPDSALAAGLFAAREREPNDTQVRALKAALTVTLGAAATGAAAGATAERAAAATHPLPAGAAVSAGGLKLSVFLALAAAVGGAAVYRHAHSVNRTMVGTAPVRASSVLPPSPAPAEPADPEVAPPAAPPSARAEGVTAGPHPRRHAGASDQLALIARAQRTLASDPGAALGLVEENRRALAQSAFAQEADVIAVAALVRLGRTDEARDRAARFVARFPDSVHAPRMRRIAGS
jgi:hypothetical protein